MKKFILKSLFFLLILLVLLALILKACQEKENIRIDLNEDFITIYEVGSIEPEWTNAFIINEGDNLKEVKSDYIDTSLVDMNNLGSFEVNLNLTNETENEVITSSKITIFIVDKTAPIISLNGDSNVTLEVGSHYTEIGAIATDNYDNNLFVTISGDTVNTSEVGEYIVSYDTIDSSNNIATQVKRRIYIVDTNLPTITLNGESEITLEVGSQYTELGALATDNYDNNLSLVIGGEIVDASTLGEYIVTYNTVDSNNNHALEITRTVKVVDATIPLIILNGKSYINIDKDSQYLELGATVSDNYDNNLSVIIGGEIVDTSTVGEYLVTYNAIDSNSNNAIEVTRIVRVVKIDAYLIGGSSEETFISVIEDSDGNYVSVGYTYSNDGDITDGNGGIHDAMIVKIDKNGNKIWDKTIGGSSYEMFSSVIEDSDGNYIAVGNTSSVDGDITNGNNGSSDTLIVKIDKNGDKIWDITIGGSSEESFYSVIEDSEGNYIAVGYTPSNDGDITDGNNGDYDGLIVKIDKNGNKIWDKTVGGSSFEFLKSVIEDSDGNYLAVGSTYSIDGDITDGNNGSTDTFIVKVDKNGDNLWNRTIGGSSYDSLQSVIEDSEGNYVAVGTSNSNDFDISGGTDNFEDALILKFDKAGNKLWDRTIESYFPIECYSVIENSEGNYLTVGSLSSIGGDIMDDNNGMSDGLTLKFDREGNKLWDLTIGGGNSDYFYSVIEDSEGNYVAVGESYSNDGDITDKNNGETDAVIVKFK